MLPVCSYACVCVCASVTCVLRACLQTRVGTLLFSHYRDPIDWLKSTVLGWSCSRVSIKVAMRPLPALDPAKPLRRRLAQSLRCALDDTMASLLPSPVLAVVQAADTVVFHTCGDKAVTHIPVDTVQSLRLSRV
eukprot:m.413447 g.413447  ORF g.413447 m.413447 type:complete len:134 (-) comp21265_c0_seq16:787-1188(-)